jgi:DNA-binding NtrC family response regulator
VVERACILAEGDMITEKDLSVNLPIVTDPPPQAAPPSFADAMAEVSADRVPAEDDRESLASIERDHIMRTLRRAGGNKKAAAKMLGLSRRALYRRLERHQLEQTITRRKGGDAPQEPSHETSGLTMAGRG